MYFALFVPGVVIQRRSEKSSHVVANVRLLVVDQAVSVAAQECGQERGAMLFPGQLEKECRGDAGGYDRPQPI